MNSNINPTLPADGVAANKGDLRGNLLAAKEEIEQLMRANFPHLRDVSGILTVADHGGRACFLVANVVAPVTDGFQILLRNKSGSTRTISPTSGSIIHQGLAVPTLPLPHLREVSLWSDGVDIWASGAVD